VTLESTFTGEIRMENEETEMSLITIENLQQDLSSNILIIYVRHGIAPNPEAYGYDTRRVRDSHEYRNRDDDAQKRPRRSEYQSSRHSSESVFSFFLII
jgi:hypothetical protein